MAQIGVQGPLWVLEGVPGEFSTRWGGNITFISHPYFTLSQDCLQNASGEIMIIVILSVIIKKVNVSILSINTQQRERERERLRERKRETEK